MGPHVGVRRGLAVVAPQSQCRALLLLFFVARVVEDEPGEDGVGEAAVAAILDGLEGRSIGHLHVVDGCRRGWRCRQCPGAVGLGEKPEDYLDGGRVVAVVVGVFS